MTRTQKRIGVLVAVFVLSGALYTVHFLKGRPDRFRAADLRVKLLDVETELLRYEHDHGSLPAQLADLVPHYMLEEDLAGLDGPLYNYDPFKREVSQTQGALIRGLYAYHLSPVRLVLPRPADRPSETKATATAADVAAAKSLSSSPPGPAAESGPDDIKLTPTPAPEIQATAPAPPQPRVDPLVNEVSAAKPAEPTPQPTSREALQAIVLQQPALPDPPPGSFVFEAEHYSSTTYGWEAHIDPQCSGGAYLHCKEGIANNSAQTKYGVGNFYDVHSQPLITDLRYYFNLPKAGTYYCYGRMWTTDTHCSNHVCLDFDSTTNEGSIDNRTPFRWVWTPITLRVHREEGEPPPEATPMTFAAGEHFIHIYIWEDGLQLDQFILSPTRITGNQAFKPNLLPNRGTRFEQHAGPPVHLSMDLKSAVISPELPPDAKLVIRRIRPAQGIANVKVSLRDAGPNGAPIQSVDSAIDLAALPELSFYPLQFPGLDLTSLAPREYLLTAELSQDGKTLAAFNVVLAKPYPWQVFGPGRFLELDAQGPLDGDGTPRTGDARRWTPFKDACFDWFGVLDFGLQFGAASKHAPEYATVYARTKIRVNKAGTYLIKVMSDDQMRLWIDGEDAFRIEDILPVTRSARSFKHYLEAGEHRIRMRINQTDGPWQAFLRVRTEDDDTADVVGIDPQ